MDTLAVSTSKTLLNIKGLFNGITRNVALRVFMVSSLPMPTSPAPVTTCPAAEVAII
jgi:hypothetical protein